MAALKAFFVWLAGEPGFRSRLRYSDADYFNSSERDARIPMTRRESPAPSLEQVRHVVFSMPATDAIERRGRALAAFILLTGVRDGAVASLELKHVDLVERCVSQDGREVATKFGKSFSTWFFPVGDDVRRIVAETKRAAGSPGPSSSNHDLRLARCRRATVGGSRCWRLRRAWTSVVRKLTWRTQ